jgi:DNA-binding NarL/FixJ family response regulator
MIGAVARRVTSERFIGRQSELDSLERVLIEAAEGAPSHVLIGGEAGVGKSRLVAQTTSLAESRGWRVLAGGCIDLGEGGLPFGPYAELLRGWERQVGAAEAIAMAGSGASELARLVPELRPAAEPRLQEQSTQARIHDAFHRLLTRLASRSPVLVVLEDLHWAGADALGLTASLLRVLRDEPVVMLMTYRTDELHRRHPLRAWLAEATRSSRLLRLELEPFDQGDLASLVQAVLGHRPSAELVETIHRRSDGNAFFAEELLAAGIERQAGLSPSLRDLLSERISTVSDPARRVMGVAAVAGRAVDDGLLAAVASERLSDLHGALREVIDAGLMVATDAPEHDGYAFRHALVQEAVYEDLLPGERRALHRAFATALEVMGERRDDAARWVELAHHWRSAKDLERGFGASIQAGDRSTAALAFAQAISEYEHALEMWDVVPDAERIATIDRIELLSRAAQARHLTSEDRRSVELYQEAVELSEQTTDRLRTGMLLERLGRVLWMSGEAALAIATTERAVATIPAHPPSAARVRAIAGLAQVHMLSGNLRRATELCRDAIERARAIGAREAEGHALNTLGSCLSELGDCGEAIGSLEEALAIGWEVRNADDIGRAYTNLAEALWRCGNTRGALERVVEGIEAANEVGIGSVYAFYIGMHGVTYAYEMGDWETAGQLYRDSVASMPHSRAAERYRLAYGLPWLVGTGSDDAIATWEQAWQMIATDPAVATTGWAPQVAGIELEIWRDRSSEAIMVADDGIARLAASGWWMLTIVLTRLGARAPADLGLGATDPAVRERAEERMTAYVREADLAAERIVTARHGLTTRVQAEMTTVAAEAARLRGTATADTWEQVRAAWQAASMPYDEAYAGARLAVTTDDAAAARAALTDALAIARRLGARPMLEWLDRIARQLRISVTDPSAQTAGRAQPARPYGLSVREMEVLALVAAGRTNRRIAERLFISENTAGVHVSNILGKLQVASRTEAASLALRAGIVEPDASDDPDRTSA